MKHKLFTLLITLLFCSSVISGCGAGSTPGSDSNNTGNESQDTSLDISDPSQGDDLADSSVDSSSDGSSSDTADSSLPAKELWGTAPVTSTIDSEELELAPTLEDASILEPMENAIESLMLTSYLNGLAYKGGQEDADFFWLALSFYITNHSEDLYQSEDVDNVLRVPAQTVQETATGLFGDYSDLPELPASFSDIQYDAGYEAYLFTLPQTETVMPGELNIVDTRSLDQGTIGMIAVLNNSQGMPIYCCTLTLAENSYADGIVDPLFPLTITAMDVSDAVISSSTESTLIASYQGLSDSHTAEFIIDGNLIAFQLKSPQIRGILSAMSEDTELTICSETDEATGCRWLKGIVGKLQ